MHKWLLNQLLAWDKKFVGTLQKRREAILSELFNAKDRDEFSATCHFEKDKKDICLTSYTVKIKSNGKKKALLCCQHPVLYIGTGLMMVRRNHRS